MSSAARHAVGSNQYVARTGTATFPRSAFDPELERVAWAMSDGDPNRQIARYIEVRDAVAALFDEKEWTVGGMLTAEEEPPAEGDWRIVTAVLHVGEPKLAAVLADKVVAHIEINVESVMFRHIPDAPPGMEHAWAQSAALTAIGSADTKDALNYEAQLSESVAAQWASPGDWEIARSSIDPSDSLLATWVRVTPVDVWERWRGRSVP